MGLLLINDTTLLQKVANGCRNKRLHLNITQLALAQRANLSLATVKKFEEGGVGNLRTLIGIFRALGEYNRLEGLILEVLESPKEIFIKEQSFKKKRRRASRVRN